MTSAINGSDFTVNLFSNNKKKLTFLTVFHLNPNNIARWFNNLSWQLLLKLKLFSTTVINSSKSMWLQWKTISLCPINGVILTKTKCKIWTFFSLNTSSIKIRELFNKSTKLWNFTTAHRVTSLVILEHLYLKVANLKICK